MSQYTREDFLDTTTPFENLYGYIEDPFEHERRLTVMADEARAVGVRNLRKLYAEYCRSMQRTQRGGFSCNVTRFARQPMQLDCGNWDADDLGVTTRAYGQEQQACCHPIMPVERLINVDTGLVKIRLAFSKGDRWRTIITDKKTVASATAILALADLDIAVTSENAKFLVQYLHDLENANYDKIPEKKSVNRLGWIDGYGFSPYVPGLVFDGEVNFRPLFENVTSDGSREEWLNLALELRQGNVIARIALAASFASVLVRYEMDIQKIPVDQIRHAGYNPRKNLKPGDAEYEKLKRSIEEFGYVEPIIWNRQTGNIVGGHQRAKVLVQLGAREIDCVVVDLGPEQEKALNVALNKVSGEWDIPLLTDLLKDLDAGGFDLSLTGFDQTELEKMATNLGDLNAKEDGSDIEELLTKASFVEPGDVWTVGRHKLLCGDATNTSDTAKLMAGEKADLCVTDPPYGISFKAPTTGLTLMNDNLKGSDFYDFLLASFKNIFDVLVAGGSAYVFHADTEGLNFRKAFIDAGFHLSGVCIWAKNSFTLGRSVYQWAHEPVLFGFKKGAAHKWFSGRGESTIWQYDKPKRNDVHGTMKPIPLIAYPIKNSSPDGGLVIDFFGGSGSTLIAAEQLNRRCYMMELDPKFASVILRRFVEFSGSSEEVHVNRNGEVIPYANLVKELGGSQ